MKNKIQTIEEMVGKGRIRQGELLSAHTSFKVGGPAEGYIDVEKVDDLVKIVKSCRKNKIPFLILGGGTNVVVSDKGFRGVIIKNNCRKFEVVTMSGRMKNNENGWQMDVSKALIVAESGVIMNQLVRFSIEQGLSGLEYQLGLPGTVGGAIFMNSNFPKKDAYVGDALYKATILTKDGEIKEVDNSYFKFGYDKSILQETNEILLTAVFRFSPFDKKELWKRGTEAMEYRNKTQPKGPSAGCVFRNISIVDALRIKTPEQTTSAGYLIDKAGLKGKKIGNAMISNDHANFILNMGGAKAEDVIALVKLCEDEVFKKFGVKLNMEVRKIGF